MQHRIETRETGQPLIRNIRLKVAFDGTAFDGWQIQKNSPPYRKYLPTRSCKVTGEM